MLRHTLLSLLAATALCSPATAQEITMDASTFGKLGWQSQQAVDRSRLNSLLERGLLEPVANYASDSVFGRLGQTIGFVDVLRADNNRAPCTGALIAPDLVLTNAHCVHVSGPKRAARLEFRLGYLTTLDPASVPRYGVERRPVERDEDHDYAILRLTEPVVGVTIPPLRVRDPRPGEPLLLFGHPLADPLHVSRGGCRAHPQVPLSGVRVNHNCDTLDGNSGSLIFSDEDRSIVVGLHHAGGVGANHGIRMAALIEESPTLAALFRAPAEPEPQADPQTEAEVERLRAQIAALQTQARESTALQTYQRALSETRRDERLALLKAVQRDFAGTEAAQLASQRLIEEERAAEVFGITADSWLSGTPGKPGSLFQECVDCPEMVVIPSGAFDMGSPKNEAQRDDDEGPVRRVTIAEPFAMGRYEVTFSEWDACAADGFCRRVADDGGWGRGQRPVINVSWNDIRTFLDWMNDGLDGAPYRLPSEAEWEYAARAGTTTPFWWGTTVSPDQANYNEMDTSGDALQGVFREQTIEVGSFSANPFGLFDVHGNVWEWVEDCYVDSDTGAPIDGSAQTASDCGYRVLRGGSWLNDPWLLRSAYRVRDRSDDRNRNIGFRLARTLTP